MQKRDDFLLKNAALSQIFIIVFSVFSFAFFIGEINFVEGQSEVRRVYSNGNYDLWNGAYLEANKQGPIPPGTVIPPSVQLPQGFSLPSGVTGGTPGAPFRYTGDTGPEVINGGPPPQSNPITLNMGNTKAAYSGGYLINDVDKGYTFQNVPGVNNLKVGDIERIIPTSDGKFQIIGKDGLNKGEALNQEQYNQLTGEITKAGGSMSSGETYKNPMFPSVTGFLGHLLSGLMLAGAVAGAVQLVGGLAGWDDSLTNSLSIALAGGIMTTSLLQSIGPTGAGWYGSNGFLTNSYGLFTGAGWIGLAAAVVLFAVLYKKESAKVVTFECLPYEAPIGGRDCEKCNDDPYRPCSEYRCRSLGQSCELVNVGSSDEKCVWVNPNDATSPTITPWTEPLTENHRYTSHATRPSSLGTRIARTTVTNGCIKAFTPLSFGITTNEPAQCKIDSEHKDTFDEMQFFFGNSNLFLYNHTQQFSLPSPDSINTEVPEMENDGKYDFFVRCRDKNGNENVDEFAIQFCVDPSPDTTAPIIVDTSIPSESYVKSGIQSVPLGVYMNEPSTCKWSTQNKEYSVMENTMTCASSITEINARELYPCSTNLTGIVDRQENKYYFRCMDQPTKPESERNVMIQSYEFILRGSQQLNIISVGPNGTVTGNSNTVPVELSVITDDGANEGTAICSFSETGNENSFIPMFETKSFEHKQRLDLATGNYDYYFRCVDYGGNAAQANVSFSVYADTTPPLITRVYRDISNNALKIVTDEDAECVYSLNSCNFDFKDGVALLQISMSNKRSHYAEWKPNLAYYIKCRDMFENGPAPNSCSLVASATNLN